MLHIKDMLTAINKLGLFCDRHKDSHFSKNEWIHDAFMKVYVRKAFHRLRTNEILTTLDIASVEVYEEYRNQGLWTEFIHHAHLINPWEATFIECVHNSTLYKSLLRHGWSLLPEEKSFYKLRTQ